MDPSPPPLSLGRKAWSLTANPTMAVGMASKAADEEARAEVEVLNSRLEKTRQLNLKISASLSRLESNGKSMQDAIGPIYGNTQKLQVFGNNIDGVLAAISRIRQPSELKNNEEEIIRKGPEKAGLTAFLNSVKRLNGALADMYRTNLRSNQQAVEDLKRLLKTGNSQLETYFANILQEDSRPIEPLTYITKEKPFPLLNPDRTSRLGLINSQLSASSRQFGGDSPVLQVYASVRGPYLTSTLQNLSSASVNTARKRTPDSVYRKDTNGIGTYAKGIEGAFLAEYDNICSLFSRDEWGKVFNLTCQGAVAELTRTLRDLNSHIKSNLSTDCFLAYEIIEIISTLSASLESRTGELKNSFANALKPIKETGKLSLADLLEDTRRRVGTLQMLPPDAQAVPVTKDTMTRLQTMVDFLPPISSIMISIGDGGWKTNAASNTSSDQMPSLASFDVTADGKQIFAHYCIDTINTLLTSLEQKSKIMLKGSQTIGAFLLNNVSVITGMIRSSDLQPLLASRMADIETWRKNGNGAYMAAWREPASHLLDVQYTNRGQRPTSGTGAGIDSSVILKNLSSKDKDSIKEKFRQFNASFDELVQRHKSLHMEREVRSTLSRSVQGMIEQLYCRFWDRYHEVDKGKGKYVKYNKADISAVFITMG